jgi:hypothetical protein
MNGARHELMLASLTHHPNPLRRDFCKDNHQEQLHSWALDETGTVATSMIECEQQKIEEITKITVMDEVLQVHRIVPPTKADKTIQIIYENINNLCNCMSNNEKLQRAKAIHNELFVNIVAYYKHQLNMGHRANCNSFNQLFKGSKAAIQLIVACNIYKNFGRTQWGDTSLMMFGPSRNSWVSRGVGKTIQVWGDGW